MIIDKHALLAELCADLAAAIEVMTAAAATAHQAATHEEMKPENDKDTRGLEAGYLAGAQSARAAQMRRALAALRNVVPRAFTDDDAVDETALVDTVENGNHARLFVCPHGGGLKARGPTGVVIVTPQSPLGEALVGKRKGDMVELELGGRTRAIEIVSVR